MVWQPGQTGNPKGRPPNGVSMTSLLGKVAKTKLPDGMTRAQAIALKLIEMAESGNLAAIDRVFDRLDGKVTDSLKLSGDAENPLTLVFTQGRDVP